MLLYAVVAILSWSVTCILCYRPIGIPTYHDYVGNHSRIQYESSDRRCKAARVGMTITAAISIPITSAICARAAATYFQRRSNANVTPLSLRQMLALADRGWSDRAVLWDILKPSTSGRTRSLLLMWSVILVGLGE